MVGTAETLLSPSAVKLYGRVVAGISIDLTGAAEALGMNRFLRNQLDPNNYKKENEDVIDESKSPRFARIYGFSYYGAYVALQRPVILLVHGPGVEASEVAVRNQEAKQLGKLNIPTDASLAPAIGTPDFSGVGAKNWEFSYKIRVWEYDRADFSLRLDIDSGPLERILIDAESGGDDRMPYFGNRLTRRRGPGE